MFGRRMITPTRCGSGASGITCGLTPRRSTTRMIMRSTLLETLLDRSLRAGSTAPSVWEVLNRKDIPDHAYFDELRWDLAQAYLCLNSSAGRRSEGVALLKQIAANEATREVRPYTDARLLNPLCYLRQPGPVETVPRQTESGVSKQTAEVPESPPTAHVASK